MWSNLRLCMHCRCLIGLWTPVYDYSIYWLVYLSLNPCTAQVPHPLPYNDSWFHFFQPLLNKPVTLHRTIMMHWVIYIDSTTYISCPQDIFSWMTYLFQVQTSWPNSKGNPRNLGPACRTIQDHFCQVFDQTDPALPATFWVPYNDCAAGCLQHK